jgi:hypothetical protein
MRQRGVQSVTSRRQGRFTLRRGRGGRGWALRRVGGGAAALFHAVAAKFQATPAAPPFDSCAFVKAVAAHHFSYAWAKRSSAGVQAARWWRQVSQAGRARSGATSTPNSGGPEPPKAGAHLFTKRELAVLPNLPVN